MTSLGSRLSRQMINLLSTFKSYIIWIRPSAWVFNFREFTVSRRSKVSLFYEGKACRTQLILQGSFVIHHPVRIPLSLLSGFGNDSDPSPDSRQNSMLFVGLLLSIYLETIVSRFGTTSRKTPPTFNTRKLSANAALNSCNGKCSST